MARPPISKFASILHRVAAVVVLGLLLGFWCLTLSAEVFSDHAGIASAKRTIAFGVLALVPVMATLGLSGRALARKSTKGLAGKKLRRMRWIGANGVLVLAPCALCLAWLAGRGSFGSSFYLVQALELVAGAFNVVLIAKNARDGLLLAGRLKKRPALRVSQSAP